jgi:hypothetical protein
VTIHHFTAWVLPNINDSETEKGGPGSGNYGHVGRPGKRGGSAPTKEGVGAAMSLSKGPTAQARQAAASGKKKPEEFVDPVEKTIRPIEKEIVGLAKEESVTTDEYGEIVSRKRGRKSSITFTNDELKAMNRYNGVFLHNHPGYLTSKNPDIREHGTSFSPEDLTLFTTDLYLTKEARVVADNTRFRMIKKDIKDVPLGSYDRVLSALKKLYRPLKRDAIFSIRLGKLSVDEANYRMSRDFSKMVAKRLDMDYIEEPLTD